MLALRNSEDSEDFGEIDGFRRFRRFEKSWRYQWIEVFQHCSAEVTKMEPTLRLTQVLKQEAEDIGLQGKDIAEYVTRQQALDRGERAAWRVAQEFHVEEKKRADEIRMAEIQAERKREQTNYRQKRKRGLMRSSWPRLR